MILKIVLLALGSLFWLVIKYQSAVKLRNFTRLSFLRKNAPPMALNLIFGIALLLAIGKSTQFEIILVGANLSEIVWFFIGMGGQLIARKMYKRIISQI